MIRSNHTGMKYLLTKKCICLFRIVAFIIEITVMQDNVRLLSVTFTSLCFSVMLFEISSKLQPKFLLLLLSLLLIVSSLR